MGEEAERLRGKTDEGRFADKVAFPDPATAPLGTDDEAAGRRPDPSALARSAAEQAAIARQVREAETTSLAPEGAPAVSYAASARRRPAWIWLVLAVAGLAPLGLVLWAIWLTFPER